MLRFDHHKSDGNVFSSAVDVYHVIFSLFGVNALRFIGKLWLYYVHSPLSILFKKLHDTIEYVTAPYADKYLRHILVKFQFTIFSHM